MAPIVLRPASDMVGGPDSGRTGSVLAGSLGHPLSHGHRYGARCRDSAGVIRTLRGVRADVHHTGAGKKSHEVLWKAELLAAAAAAEGRPTTAVLAGPGVSLCTIDGRATADAGLSPVADALIVQEPAEFSRADIFTRLSPEAYLLVNSVCGFGDLGVGERVEQFCRDRALILPVARLQLGLHDVAVRSSALLGGFAALSRAVSLDSVISAIDRMPGSPAWACAEAAMAGYEFVRAEREALAI